MKVFVSITLRGLNTAVYENVEALFGALDSAFLDTCTFLCDFVSEEENEE